MKIKMSKQAEINYLRGRVNQLENQLAAAQSWIAEHKPCQCGHHRSDHDEQGQHACGQCDCGAFSVGTSNP